MNSSRLAATIGLCTLCLVLGAPTLASDAGTTTITDNTLRLAEGAKQPEATLADVAWLAGNWVGQGLGGLVEEAWTAPSGGSMVGLFKLLSDGKPNFYELMVIAENEGTIELRLKHFNPDMTGWEEKDDFLTFPLVKVEGKTAYFRGLTYRLTEDDTLKIYLAMKSQGSYREATFDFERTQP